MVGTYGTILHSTDGAKNWNVKSESTSEPLAGVDVSPTGSGWGRRGAIYRTQDSGKTWEKQESGVVAGLNKVFAVDDKEAWAIGDSGYTLHTKDGKEWSVQKGYDWLGLHDVQFL